MRWLDCIEKQRDFFWSTPAKNYNGASVSAKKDDTLMD